ncbi:MAG: prealbumin-like fold domain-containing protein [Blautia sp.]
MNVEAIESVTENVIKNVSFVIYDSDGNKYKTIVTEEDGKCNTTLPYGVYTIQITGVPEGYNDEKAIQTIKLSELNLEQNIRFTIDLKPTISEIMTETEVDAAQAYYTVKMLLEKKENCKYTYDGTELSESTTAAEVPDLADSITTKDYDGTTMYLVSFKVQS